MNDEPKTELSMWERSTLVRMFRWLFSWRGIRRILIVTAWVATVIGLWYGEENWRGRHDWNKYRREVEAKGESLDFTSYIPKPVPDDQNFAATPFFKFWLEGDIHKGDFPAFTNDLYGRADDNVYTTNIVKFRELRHFTDLVAWQQASIALQSGKLQPKQHFETDNSDLGARAAAAPAVLEGLKPDAEVFAQLRSASSRKYSRFPVVYDLENPWDIWVPHLAPIKRACQRLTLQACAELAFGQTDLALADVKLMLALADSVKTEPFLVSYMVRALCLQIAIQPVWEGLAERRWTDAQLRELQARFLNYDFLTDAALALTAERAVGGRSIDLVKGKGPGFVPTFTRFMPDSENNSFYETEAVKEAFKLGRLIYPSGWYYQEQLDYSRLFDALMKGVIDPAEKRVSPSTALSNEMELIRQISGSAFHLVMHHRLMAAVLLQDPPHLPLTGAKAQVAADQAALACALERYRLANGQFPETLDALTPRFISHAPNDVITGQPYKYRRTEDGQFVLYSVGWNEKDDGGAPGKTLWDPANGDWVWSYPAK